MAQESQITPLAPTKIYGRSDEEFASTEKPKAPKKSSKCLVYFLLAVVIQSIIFLVFATAVLRVEAPRVRLRSVAVKNLVYVSQDASINATLVAEMEIENKNFGRFNFEDSSVSVLYQNVTVGGERIDGGRVRARKKERVSVTVEVRSNELLRESRNFTSDAGSGLVELSGYAKVVGRVHVMKIVNKRRSKLMNCTMGLDLKTESIRYLRCN